MKVSNERSTMKATLTVFLVLFFTAITYAQQSPVQQAIDKADKSCKQAEDIYEASIRDANNEEIKELKAIQSDIMQKSGKEDPSLALLQVAAIQKIIDSINSPALGTPKEVFLSTLNPESVDCYYFLKGTLSTTSKKPIAVNGGPASPHGLFTHPFDHGKATVVYNSDGKYHFFITTVGIADNNSPPPASPVTFSVFGDNKKLWTSKPMTKHGDCEKCSIDITGVKHVELIVSVSGSYNDSGPVWIEPKFSDNANSAPQDSQTNSDQNNSRPVPANNSDSGTYVGPRGGVYHYSANGHKIYEK